MKHPKVIFITGASSGIGEALAQRYAQPGCQIYLTGRNQERLDHVAHACRHQGAEVATALTPVEDRSAMHDLIRSWHSENPIDLVIANAGVDGSAYEGDEIYYKVMEINVTGVLNTVLPALACMKERGKGQIGIVSSLAGLRGMPGAVAYAASKNAVRALAEGLRGRHRADGIDISAICPGFVDSRITASNKFPMPMKWPADKAANFIADKLARNKSRIAFPWPMYLSVWFLCVLPVGLSDWILRRAPRKQ